MMASAGIGLRRLLVAGSKASRRGVTTPLLPVAGPRVHYHVTPSCSYIPRRAVLYVPADDVRKIQKIPTLNVDCAVLDCEDGVALNRKAEARIKTVEALENFDFGQTEKCVRINSVSSGLAEEDMKVILKSKILPTSLMLPKVDNVEEIKWFIEKCAWHLQSRTLVEPINFIPFVETAMGLLNFKAVCEETLRREPQVGLHLDAVVFGGEDFRASIGKQVIHPNQVPIVQEQFSPSLEKIKWAQELITAFEEHQRAGKGAFTFHGSMIDMPLLKQAQNIVTLATAIKKK
ncbi:citramalyl-CoA lyase, mitochondrial isoform X3 [Notechis scutatus]|uniref:Citramalyl-CoA lyase, mitochondrial isoform X3 n=1 Tax=Notechis scutatus TaxID=8663 RepID=A0A6J1U315_9SAUR|nr:citramalyl-CoA lyase, mitochondrial isoform X3 [Notechis scutatus]